MPKNRPRRTDGRTEAAQASPVPWLPPPFLVIRSLFRLRFLGGYPNERLRWIGLAKLDSLDPLPVLVPRWVRWPTRDGSKSKRHAPRTSLGADQPWLQQRIPVYPAPKGKDAAATLSRRLSRPIIQPLLMLSMSTSARECHPAVRAPLTIIKCMWCTSLQGECLVNLAPSHVRPADPCVLVLVNVFCIARSGKRVYVRVDMPVSTSIWTPRISSRKRTSFVHVSPT
jgi:hypothetical protein